VDNPIRDLAFCAGAVMKDRQLAARAAAAVAAMTYWLPQKWDKLPCFSCRATGHTHERRPDGTLAWERCPPCEGQGWFWRQRPGGAEYTDREIVILYEREQRRRL
jgi:hypothetical protein